jgi:hypothetical protein
MILAASDATAMVRIATLLRDVAMAPVLKNYSMQST